MNVTETRCTECGQLYWVDDDGIMKCNCLNDQVTQKIVTGPFSWVYYCEDGENDD